MPLTSSHHQACLYQDLFRSDISFLRYRGETKKVSNFCSIFRSCDLDLCPTNLNINRLPPLTYQVSFRSNISFLSNFCSIFRSCDLDLCPTNLNINRLPPLTIRHMCTKFHLDPTFCS